jgi:hypothetical protein
MHARASKDHIHYATLDEAGVPVRSGAVESHCSQFQDRFKCTGQFWSDQGFANLLAVDLRVRNDELQHLWAAELHKIGDAPLPSFCLEKLGV